MRHLVGPVDEIAVAHAEGGTDHPAFIKQAAQVRRRPTEETGKLHVPDAECPDRVERARHVLGELLPVGEGDHARDLREQGLGEQAIGEQADGRQQRQHFTEMIRDRHGGGAGAEVI